MSGEKVLSAGIVMGLENMCARCESYLRYKRIVSYPVPFKRSTLALFPQRLHVLILAGMVLAER